MPRTNNSTTSLLSPTSLSGRPQMLTAPDGLRTSGQGSIIPWKWLDIIPREQAGLCRTLFPSQISGTEAGVGTASLPPPGAQGWERGWQISGGS
jgi:hypothetical protein